VRTTRIVVFAKAPVPGLAKTRLIPAIGAARAAALARQMLDHSIAQARSSGVGPVELCATPDFDQHGWHDYSIPPDVEHSNQGEGSLGRRMARAAQRVIDAGERLLLIGSDCPQLGANVLAAAVAALAINDACIVPAADGGYVLIGLNRFDPSIFDDIAWSTDSVAIETMRRFQGLNWRVASLPVLRDIDEPHDLEYLPTNWLAKLHA
jgi:uncharacterized protein